MAEKPRLRVPSEAKKGDIIQIKTLMSHPMETGYRKDETGKPIPREIINSFVCTFNGHEVFRADLEPAISATRLTLVSSCRCERIPGVIGAPVTTSVSTGEKSCSPLRP